MWTLCRRLRIVKCHATRVAKLTRDFSTTRDMSPSGIPRGGRRGRFRLVEGCDSRRRDDEGERHQGSEGHRLEALHETETRTINYAGDAPGRTTHAHASGRADTRRGLHGTTDRIDRAPPPAGAGDSGHLDDFDAHVSSCCHHSLSNLCSKHYINPHAVSNTFSIPVASSEKSTPRHRHFHSVGNPRTDVRILG